MRPLGHRILPLGICGHWSGLSRDSLSCLKENSIEIISSILFDFLKFLEEVNVLIYCFTYRLTHFVRNEMMPNWGTA